MKFLGPQRVAHTFDLHHHESQLRQRLAIAAGFGERPVTDASTLRSRIDAVDDRIFPAAIEIRGLKHQPVQVGSPVARLHGDWNRGLPSGGHQARDILLLDRIEQLSALVANHGDSRQVGLRVAIDKEVARRRE